MTQQNYFLSLEVEWIDNKRNYNENSSIPASNGIEWMSIYAKDDTLKTIVEHAEKNCQQKDYYKTQGH